MSDSAVPWDTGADTEAFLVHTTSGGATTMRCSLLKKTPTTTVTAVDALLRTRKKAPADQIMRYCRDFELATNLRKYYNCCRQLFTVSPASDRWDRWDRWDALGRGEYGSIRPPARFFVSLHCVSRGPERDKIIHKTTINNRN